MTEQSSVNRPQKQASQQMPDDEIDLDQLDDTGYELVLPSGAKIGHRSLFRYYRYVIIQITSEIFHYWNFSGSLTLIRIFKIIKHQVIILFL